MADRYLLESGAPDGYLNEDGSGVLLLEAPSPPGVPGGQVITSAKGTLVKSVSKALVGIALVASAGIVVATGDNAVQLVGSAATSAVGSVVQSHTVDEVFGQDVFVSQGVFTTRLIINSSTGIAKANSTVPIVGQFLTGAQGLAYPSVLIGSDLSVPVAGQVSTSATGTVQVPGTRALVGSVTTSAHGIITIVLRPTDIVGQVITSARGILTPLGNDVTVNITGTLLTSQQGFVNASLLTGQVSTSATGTLAYSTDRAITGLAITSALGIMQANQEAEEDTYIASALETPALLMELPLGGTAITSGMGNVGITSDITIALTGSESVSVTGTTIYTRIVPLFGEDATVETGNVSTPASVELVGLAITGLQGTIFTTNDRSVALIGAGATWATGSLVANPRLNVNGLVLISASGIMSFTTDAVRELLGQSTTLAAGVLTPLADRTFMLTGQEMTAQQGLTFANVDGSVMLLGHSMTAQQGQVVAPNVVTLTGQAIIGVQASLSHPTTESFEPTGLEAMFHQGTMTVSGAEAGTPSGSNEGCHIVSRVAQEGCGVVSDVAQERSDSESGTARESNINEV